MPLATTTHVTPDQEAQRKNTIEGTWTDFKFGPMDQQFVTKHSWPMNMSTIPSTKHID